MLHFPKASDHVRGVRYHDVKDARAAGESFAQAKLAYRRALAQIADKHGAAEAARVGNRSYRRSRVGSTGTGSPAGSCVRPNAECDDLLGFNTLPTAGFPVAGGGVGVLTATPAVVVDSGRACSFVANAMFFEGRDAANALAVVAPTLLSSAIIAGQEQLLSTAAGTGISSAVFGLTSAPLPIGWDAWSTNAQQTLTMIYGNVQAAAVTLEIFGVFWGQGSDQNLCKQR